jgi:hypothetical protein
MRPLIAIFLAIAGVLAVCKPIFAHHGNSSYDTTNPVTLEGTVTKFEFINPHALIYFDVKDKSGNSVHWACETLAPGKLARAGWVRDTLKPGDQVTITLAPTKDGKPLGLLQKVVAANGKVISTQETPY